MTPCPRVHGSEHDAAWRATARGCVPRLLPSHADDLRMRANLSRKRIGDFAGASAVDDCCVSRRDRVRTLAAARAPELAGHTGIEHIPNPAWDIPGAIQASGPQDAGIAARRLATCSTAASSRSTKGRIC